jgi:predicted CopG family antitoxin
MSSNPKLTLTDDEKALIRAEEVFREEIRANFSTRPKTLGARTWTAINSSFVIFILSSVLLSLISWQYQSWSARQQKKTSAERLTQESSIELNYRVIIMLAALEKPEVKGHDARYVRAVFFGQEPYIAGITRFRGVSVPAIMYLLGTESVSDLLDKMITKAMPQVSIAVENFAAYKDDEVIDQNAVKEIRDTLKKIKTLSLKW